MKVRNIEELFAENPHKGREFYKPIYDFIVQFCKEHHGAFPQMRVFLEKKLVKSTGHLRYMYVRMVQFGMLGVDQDTGYYIVGSEWLSPEELREKNEKPEPVGT